MNRAGPTLHLRACTVRSRRCFSTISGFCARSVCCTGPVDAYNEFGEGGIVAPTQGDGHMKLDTIAKVIDECIGETVRLAVCECVRVMGWLGV